LHTQSDLNFSRASVAALSALGWTCILLRYGFKSVEALQGKHFTKLVRWCLFAMS